MAYAANRGYAAKVRGWKTPVEVARMNQKVPEAWERLVAKRPAYLSAEAAEATGPPPGGFELGRAKYAGLYQRVGTWRPTPISAEDVTECLRWPQVDVFVFDVRGDEAPGGGRRGDTLRLPNAIHIPLSGLAEAIALPHAAFWERYLSLKPQWDDTVICVSCDGEDSELAAVMWRIGGFQRVFNCREGTRALLGDTGEDNPPMDDEAYADLVARRIPVEESPRRLASKALRKRTFGDLKGRLLDRMWPDEIAPSRVPFVRAEDLEGHPLMGEETPAPTLVLVPAAEIPADPAPPVSTQPLPSG